ncbi:carbon-nitrogen family hydrolase [Halanaeroarchaeum sulfurireducens]|uniref:Apolipoprotein N-acyltransferase n=1 Tax=Halanaeroarchaeum sulfurireducens TaxID=1604004 RepID=A0A0F7PBY8_9EURY|nr:carbon-nitrogen family hydrolase [Halanaeroarchaeum sulfurireducens]AKH97655.1 apolipoprotein N- acyltransferase [Halanaeroarchaeum sulfurireducens]
MKLALAQLDIGEGAVETNRRRAVEAIETAADRGADLVGLPELWNVGFFAFDRYRELAEPLDGPTLSMIRETASSRDVGVMAGSIVEDLAASDGDGPADDGLANTTVLFDRDGNRLATYRKRHLFGYESEESDLLVPGETFGVGEFEGFTIGLSTCYDLRFPELYRELADRDVTLALVPSAWPYPRVEHWKTLSRARAVENLFYVATINGAAEFDAATLLGRSTVYDPWGTEIASSGDQPTLVLADIDPNRVNEVRDAFPALVDRRD